MICIGGTTSREGATRDLAVTYGVDVGYIGSFLRATGVPPRVSKDYLQREHLPVGVWLERCPRISYGQDLF